VAVSGLSLNVEPGEVVGLLGANGAGKSTTLYMLTGLVPRSSGSVTVFGKDLDAHYLFIAARTGVLTERPAFYDYLSARQNLHLLARLSRSDVTIDRVLDRVGLLPHASRKVRTFSHGMRQRLGLAQALLTEPRLLILDEPTNGLDAEGAQEVVTLLRRLADEAKVTVIFSSHVLPEVESLADKVAVLNKGRLIAFEQTRRLLAYDTRVVEVLLDAPAAAARQLGQQPWVSTVSAGPDRVRVVLSDGSIHQLAGFLMSAGFVLSGVIPRRRTLQDYFLEVLSA
jgi:ABC-2 type transport system ATP-binding protein